MVTCIYTVIEYIPNAAFNSFMTQVVQACLDGDRDKDKALIAETIKLIGNSSYGKLITNKEKHHDIVYVNESEIGAEIMDNHFYSLTELPNGYYEVEKRNRKLFSIFLFTSVSLYSTMRSFVCSNFVMIASINTFLVRTLSTVRWTWTWHIWQSLETVLKVLSNQIFVKNSKMTNINGSSPQECCKENVLLDFSRLNFQRDKIISLCSKSYYTELFATENSPSQVKFSMKGVNKGQFKKSMPHYEHVLNTKEIFGACKSGIRAKDQSMVIYKQEKNALTYFYPKRKVLQDGRSTVPLNI